MKPFEPGRGRDFMTTTRWMGRSLAKGNLIKNLLLKFFGAVIILFLVALTVGFFYLKANGKDILTRAMEKQLGIKASFRSLEIFYPLTIRVREVAIQDYGTARELRISPSLLHLFSSQVFFSRIEIIEPDLIVRRKKDSGALWISQVPVSQSVPAKEGFVTNKEPNILIFEAQKIIVRDGRITVFESFRNESKFFAQLQGLQVEIKNFSFPFIKPERIEFRAQGNLSGFDNRFSGEEMQTFGWVDFYSKDMSAQLRLMGLDQSLGLEAEAVSANNDMTVKGKINLSFQTKTSSRKPKANVGDLFMQAMQSSGINMDLNFQFKTKMDDFKMGQIAVSGAIKKEEVQNP